MLVHPVYRSVFLYERERRLLAHARNAGNMVRFIAHQSFQFHDLQRRYARFVFEILLVEFENIAHAFTGETNARRIVH